MISGIEVDGEAFVVPAALLAELLGVPAREVAALMQTSAITSICERGAEDDEGKFRLSFFYRNRRARLSVDTAGRVLRRSVVDFGDRPLPARLRRGGD